MDIGRVGWGHCELCARPSRRITIGVISGILITLRRGRAPSALGAQILST